ncbi:hypothetical protein D3C71_1144090 [compost metagenome]
MGLWSKEQLQAFGEGHTNFLQPVTGGIEAGKGIYFMNETYDFRFYFMAFLI